MKRTRGTKKVIPVETETNRPSIPSAKVSRKKHLPKVVPKKEPVKALVESVATTSESDVQESSDEEPQRCGSVAMFTSKILVLP
jgi:hypothetical protein